MEALDSDTNCAIFHYKDRIDKMLDPGNYLHEMLVSSQNGITFSCHPRFIDTPMHSHSYIEMIYVYSGQCHQVINNSSVTLYKGDICIIDMKVRHLIESAGENDIIINCLMSRSYLENVLLSRLTGNDLFLRFFTRAIYNNDVCNNYMIFRSGKSDKINHFMTDLLCEGFDRAVCWDEIINSYMMLILSEILRSYINDTETKNCDNFKDLVLSDIILYIQNNCNTATLASTAEQFHFNPNYLSMMLKRASGHNFTNILHEARLKKACMLLSNSDMVVVEIANLVGYRNINYFYRIFRNHYGVTPADYRRKKLIPA